MKKLLFLTNKNNGSFKEEDSDLIDFLSKYFELIVSHPKDCLPVLHKVQGVIIRNIWPTHEYADEWKEVEQKIIESKLPTYNNLSAKGDVKGKDYLLELFQDNYPVIPTVDKFKDIDRLGVAEYYWIKPKDGCDGYGSGKYVKDDLVRMNLIDYIIQPYIEFVSEPSFFFIDNMFSHAIIIPNRLDDKDIKEYSPSDEEVALAKCFVEWNDLSHGIQRIDFVKLNDSSLLLTEVEDLCPYLY